VSIINGPAASMGGGTGSIINEIVVPNLLQFGGGQHHQQQHSVTMVTERKVSDIKELSSYVKKLSMIDKTLIGIIDPTKLLSISETTNNHLTMEYIFKSNDVAILAMPTNYNQIFYKMDLLIDQVENVVGDKNLIDILETVSIDKILFEIESSSGPVVVMNYIGSTSTYPLYESAPNNNSSILETILGYKLFCIDLRGLFDNSVKFVLSISKNPLGQSSIISTKSNGQAAAATTAIKPNFLTKLKRFQVC